MSSAAGDRLLGPADVRRLAAELELRPTKRFGQNFVIDANTIRRTIRAAAIGGDDVVLEIGPGLGSLTLGLLQTAARVVAVEIDPVLAAALPGTVADHLSDGADRLAVVHADALTLTDIPGPPPTALVANLPYNVAVPVLLRMLETMPTVEHGVVMVQAEVADRLTAPPGSRTYGAPSVKLAWWAEATRTGSIARTVFWPVPNVDSALVRWVRRPPPATTVAYPEVSAVIDAAFAQRRKSLRGALAARFGSAPLAEDVLRAAGIDPTARGESLDVMAFARLAEAARAVRSGP